MSAIAGIIFLDGARANSGLVEMMTAAMARRGPDGIRHWTKQSVGLGHCLFCTTPESVREIQPLANEDESLVLVMDGRLDNFEDLRAELLQRGCVLRDRSDAELVLRAYEVWGEDCGEKLSGGFVFFIWDARRRELFGARDAIGGRCCYYHMGNGWFAFASEIKGLLALGQIETKLNESRLVDYLLPEFSADDVVSTFYKGINRLPAGNAMRVDADKVKVWRYWNPQNLPAANFASLDECAEAFLDQLRISVRRSLRSTGRIGATLSGGLDSSAIVALISKEFRGSLSDPLQTFSLTRSDQDSCLDWIGIQEMLKDQWLVPTVLSSDLPSSTCNAYLESTLNADEPFAMHDGLFTFLTCEWARAAGCKVVLTGSAGDMLFYSYNRSVNALYRERSYRKLPAMLAAARWHGDTTLAGASVIFREFLGALAPRARSAYRRLYNKYAIQKEEPTLLRPELAGRVRAEKLAQRLDEDIKLIGASDQFLHARAFMGGLVSFAYEGGAECMSLGVEGRCPYNREMAEFAIRMPVEAKLFAPCYKYFLRKAMDGILPEKVRWERALGANPLFEFYERLARVAIDTNEHVWEGARNLERLGQWIDGSSLEQASRDPSRRRDRYRLIALNHWLIRTGL